MERALLELLELAHGLAGALGCNGQRSVNREEKGLEVDVVDVRHPITRRYGKIHIPRKVNTLIFHNSAIILAVQPNVVCPFGAIRTVQRPTQRENHYLLQCDTES